MFIRPQRYCRLRLSGYSLLFIVPMLLGCSTANVQPTLYERMGGNQVIVGIVDDTIDGVVADARTKRSFDGVNLKWLKHSLVMKLCVLAQGPCEYEGDSMRDVHKGLKITAAEFDLMVAQLRVSLDKRVGTREKNELLRLLAPMKRDVVSG